MHPSKNRTPISSLLFLQKILDILIFYNFYISFAATFLTYSTFYLLQKNFDEPFYLLIFIFSSTMLTYNIDRERSYQQYPIFIFLNITSFLLLIYAFFQLSFIIQKYLIHIALIAGLYAIPRVLGKISRLSLRHIPLLKVFLIAYVWTIVTSILPILSLSGNIENQLYLPLFGERFCFFLAITLPFDIGDWKQDESRGVKTLVMFLGIQNVKIISIMLVLCFWILIFFYYSFYFFLLQGLLILIIVLSILNIKQETSAIYYRRVLDGSILLYALLNIVSVLLN